MRRSACLHSVKRGLSVEQFLSPPSRISSLLRSPLPLPKPRHPIVLCHGLYGFDSLGLGFLPYRISYWHDVLRIFEKLGVRVITPAVPSTGSVETRARALHEYLEKSVKGPVNLVGHSMGGLDCRYLVSNIKPTTYTPVSLTTLSTPHRGSPFMAWCKANIGVGSSPTLSTLSKLPYSLKTPLLYADAKMKDSIRSHLSLYLLKLLDSPAYSNLHPDYLSKHFNPSTPDSPEVRYFSIAAKAQIGIAHPLWLPKVIMDAASESSEGNDGLVSVESAKWGEFLGTVETDHWTLRGAAGWSKISAPSPSKDEEWTWERVNTLVSETRILPTLSSKPGVFYPTIENLRFPVAKDKDGAWNGIAEWLGRRIGGGAKKEEARVEDFDLERFYGALCRVLYEEGF